MCIRCDIEKQPCAADRVLRRSGGYYVTISIKQGDATLESSAQRAKLRNENKFYRLIDRWGEVRRRAVTSGAFKMSPDGERN